MPAPEDPKGVETPSGEVSSSPPSHQTAELTTDAPNTSSDYAPTSTVTEQPGAPPPVLPQAGGGSGGSNGPPPTDTDGDADEDGMLRMSFMEHLEELRKRLLYMLGGTGVAFVLSLSFSNDLWRVVSAPAVDALRELKVNPPDLVLINPMDTFQIIWMKLPILCSVFIASPWILYQIWAFIAPGLYKKERRWAAPFVLCSAGLFILGGLFAYFVAFRYGLKFLLGIGIESHVKPMVSVTDYFDLFVNVILGVGIVFEMPILIFFLTLLRIVTPKFLLRHSRYAILAIVILAAIITPTPDVFNLMLFATPMIVLFYVGILASYILVLHRENRRFPWKNVLLVVLAVLLLVTLLVFGLTRRYGYHFIYSWPFLSR